MYENKLFKKKLFRDYRYSGEQCVDMWSVYDCFVDSDNKVFCPTMESSDPEFADMITCLKDPSCSTVDVCKSVGQHLDVYERWIVMTVFF